MWFLPVAALASSDLPLPTRPALGNPPATPTEEPVPVEAASLVFDCKVPAEVLVDGVKVGQLYFPGLATWRVAPGPHTVRLYVAGTPQDHPLTVEAGGTRTFLVGRSGTTVSDAPTAPPAASGPARVGIRVVGVPAAQLRIDDRRELVQAGAELVLELAPGPHPMSLRNADGTAIWSTGVLEVGGGAIILQVSEGRMPEVSGSAVYHSGG
jgi:hypothetical protein